MSSGLRTLNLDYSINFETFQEAWLKFWNDNGEAILLDSWLRKYGNYVLTDHNDTQNDQEKKCNVTDETLLTNSKNLNENNDGIESEDFNKAWGILWEHHCEVEYKLKYNEFFQNFVQEDTTADKSAEVKLVSDFFTKIQSCDSEELDLVNSSNLIQEKEIEYIPLDENKTLISFGLPTCFGHKKSRKKNLQTSMRNVYSETDEIQSPLKFDVSDECLVEDNSFLENPFYKMNVEEIVRSECTVKRKQKKTKRRKKIPMEIRNNKFLVKYWQRRYSLFSLFDAGIKLDEESWFSVTPEKIAVNIAERLKCDIIIDAFCGCGGNTIQFAFTCNKVIAIDIDAKKIELAKHNAKIYGIDNKIDFIVGDFLNLYHRLKADVIFLSPPWGGPEYIQQKEYDIEKDLQPLPASELIKNCRQVTNNIAIYLPKNSNINQIIKIAGQGNTVEIGKNFLNDKNVALTAFYGNLVVNN